MGVPPPLLPPPTAAIGVGESRTSHLLTWRLPPAKGATATSYLRYTYQRIWEFPAPDLGPIYCESHASLQPIWELYPRRAGVPTGEYGAPHPRRILVTFPLTSEME